MSKWRQGRRRNEAHRELNRYGVSKRYGVTNGQIDYDRPYYRVRPRGFDTILFDVRKPETTATSDFERFMDAVQALSLVEAR